MEHWHEVGLNKLNLSNIIQNSQQKHQIDIFVRYIKVAGKSFSPKFFIMIFNEKVTAVILYNFFPGHSPEITIYLCDSISF